MLPHLGHKIALFGESEKGDFHSLLSFSSLPILAETLGNPPEGSHGLHLAIQTLLFKKEVIFIRVKEEGFSLKDYIKGLSLLKESEKLKEVSAICMPGVGHNHVLEEAFHYCHQFGSILITTEKDFYDYLTSFPKS